MLEAAPTAQRYRGTLFCLASVIAGITTLLYSVDHASARVQYGAGHEGTTRASLWGLALDGRQGDEPSAELLAAARNAGVNAIVTDPRRFSPARHRELIGLARKMGMLLIEPRRPSALSRDVRAQRDRCQAQRRELQACALVAKSAHEALALARRGTVDYVVVQLSSLAELARLKAAPSMRTQLIGVLTVGASPTLEADWTQAIATSAKAGRARLAVGLSGSAARTAIRDYFRLVSIHEGIAGTQAPAASTGAAATAVSADSGTDRGRGSTVDAAAAINRPGAGGGVGHDQTPPSQPGGLTANGVTTTTANLSWTASTDNVGVVGYGIYVVNGIWSPGTPLGPPVGSTKATFFTVSGLSCGSTYTLAVDAYDRAGNRSVPATKTTQTSACPSVDTQPPSVPGNLHTTSATQTSIGIAWSPSTDNVGVTGYAIYDNGSRVGQTSASSYTVSGLPCGTSHTLSVAAVDAAGNSSQQASVRARTATCSGSTDTQAPTVPGGLHVTTATTSSITVAWTASSDNVGVAGYGLYRNGTSVGTTTLLTATFSGLACGSGYTLAVDAYDAAGNRSQQASVSAPTAACPQPPPDKQATTVPR